MKNTKKRGILHYRIFKWRGKYLGICKETGFVEEMESFKLVKDKLLNGTMALLNAINKSSQNLEASLNTSPPLKYLIYYHIAPVLVIIELIKDILLLKEKEGTDIGFSSFKKPIPLHF